MKIRILGDAEQDLLDGASFYEKQSLGLGDYFIDSLFADIDSLQLYAGIHVKKFGYYRLLSKRFPYAIYYTVQGEVIDIYAILDCRRNPSKSEDRLK